MRRSAHPLLPLAIGLITACAVLLVGSGSASLLHLLSVHSTCASASHTAACAAEERECCGHEEHTDDAHQHDAPSNHTSPTSTHDDRDCGTCITLASLVTPLVSLAIDATPIATLVGVTMLVDDLVASPSPLTALGARPPPQRA